MAKRKRKPGIGTPSPPRLHVSVDKFSKFESASSDTWHKIEPDAEGWAPSAEMTQLFEALPPLITLTLKDPAKVTPALQAWLDEVAKNVSAELVRQQVERLVYGTTVKREVTMEKRSYRLIRGSTPEDRPHRVTMLLDRQEMELLVQLIQEAKEDNADYLEVKGSGRLVVES